MQPSQLWLWLHRIGVNVSQPIVRNLQALLPWLIIVVAILFRVLFYGPEDEDPAAVAAAEQMLSAPGKVVGPGGTGQSL
jgi:hypothetical protein